MTIFFRKNRAFFTMLIVLIITVMVSTEAFAAELNSVKLSAYTPKESSEVLNNPLMGWAPDARNTDYKQPIRLVFALLTWNDLEPQKGYYNFDAIESKYNFKTWHDRDVKIILRIVLDYSSDEKHKDIPDWLYDEINGDGTWYDGSVGKGFSPNYENPTLIAYHEKLISALGERYNNSGDIAYIELGSIGHWGEWHTMQSDSVNIPFPSEATANTYVGHYLKSFPSKKLLMRKPFEIAKSQGLGLYNDMFGSHQATITSYLDWINNGYFNSGINKQVAAMPDFWINGPSGGELGNGADGLQYFNKDKFADTLAQAKATHLSWLGPNTPAYEDINCANQSNYNTFLKTIGYRFVIKTVNYPGNVNLGESANISINIANKGIAPFYYNWPVVLSLVDNSGNVVYKKTSSEDIRKWLPGSRTFSANIDIPKDIKPGSYKLAISILDPSTGKPSVKFANDGIFNNGAYFIGNVSVK